MNSQLSNSRGLDNPQSRSTIPGNSGEKSSPDAVTFGVLSGYMTAKSPAPPQNANMKQPCKHPRVQIVSRDEESEFVECKECGEIFESSEFKDMNIEERTRDNDI